jgi:glycosyltransferase involved in cell wall biosynthesis
VTSTAPLVLLVAHRLAYPQASGVGRYVRSLSTALATTTDPDVARYAIAASAEAEPADWAPPSLAVHRIPGSRKLLNLRWAIGPWPRVERLVPEPTLVHALEAFTPVRSHLPRVWSVLDVMPITNPGWYGRRHRFLARRALDVIRRAGDIVIVISGTVADQLVELGVERTAIRVVHLGVDPSFRQLPPDDEVTDVCRRLGVRRGEFLLAVGGISHRKNLATVAAAIRRLSPSGDGSELVVVGPERHGAAAVLAELEPLGDRVRIAGYLPDREVLVLMHACRALVHPSRDEGFGLVTVEAMAAGTAVLAGRAGAVPEVVGDAAVLIDPEDVDAWAEAIDAVRRDDDHRDRLVAAGAERARGFTWERVAADTRAVHLEALGGPRLG